MGLQCFKELFPFCKTTFEVRKSSCDLVNILGSAVSLALIHPWFQTCTNSGSSVNLECFFLGSFVVEAPLLLCLSL